MWELFLLATAVGHSLMAVVIFRYAGKRLRDGRPLAVFGRWGWTLATLGTGAVGAVAYWLCHRGK